MLRVEKQIRRDKIRTSLKKQKSQVQNFNKIKSNTESDLDSQPSERQPVNNINNKKLKSNTRILDGLDYIKI